jgi:hypothetical protein
MKNTGAGGARGYRGISRHNKFLATSGEDTEVRVIVCAFQPVLLCIKDFLALRLAAQFREWLPEYLLSNLENGTGATTHSPSASQIPFNPFDIALSESWTRSMVPRR